ncbi:hypothetical protein BDR05DRAFT_997343 [Suillus weaverae]|nr:hypothetical protein BDR05DRAFT_997343 [Suillus weaverae]
MPHTLSDIPNSSSIFANTAASSTPVWDWSSHHAIVCGHLWDSIVLKMDRYCHKGSMVGGSPSVHSKIDLAPIFLQCVVECAQKQVIRHVRWWLGKSLTISNGRRLSETQHTSSALCHVKFVWLHSVKDLLGLSAGVLTVGDSRNDFGADLAGILCSISSLQYRITPT